MSTIMFRMMILFVPVLVLKPHVLSTSTGTGISITMFSVLAIDPKVKLIYLFVSLSWDSFSHCFSVR